MFPLTVCFAIESVSMVHVTVALAIGYPSVAMTVAVTGTSASGVFWDRITSCVDSLMKEGTALLAGMSTTSTVSEASLS